MTWGDATPSRDAAADGQGTSVRPASAWQRKPWRPLATYGLLATMVGVYVLQIVVLEATLHGPLRAAVRWHGVLHFWPDLLFVINTDWMWRPWSLLSSTLSHDFGNPYHLVFNGLFLFFFGPAVERVLGWKRTLALFFVGGAVSGVAQVHLVAWQAFGNPMAYELGGGALGASGALMAFLGTLVVLMPQQKVALLMIPVPVPLWVAGIGYAALDIFGVVYPGGQAIGHYAHLSGMALGLVYGLVVRQQWRQRGLRLVYH